MSAAAANDGPTEHIIRAWTRRHSGTWTAQEETELQGWIEADPRHRAAYDRVAKLWGMAERVPERLRAPTRSRRRFIPHYMIAASCAAVLIAALMTPGWRVARDWWYGVPLRWTTDRGATRALLLKDGTRVLLGADSELRAQMGAHMRRVSLIRGEALFTVVHDASRPFEVAVDSGRIADFGTRFNVERMSRSVRIAVLEGRVGIETAHGEMSLAAGSSSGFDSAGFIMPVRAIDESAASWEDGQRHFDAEPLADVVERLTRYHAVSFVFADPQVRQLRLSGTFRIGDLGLFLRTLGAALPVETRWLDAQRVEISARPVAGDQSAPAR